MKKILSLLTISISFIAFGQNSTITNWHTTNKSKSEVVHNDNFENTLNYYKADVVASFRQCQDKQTNVEKTSCFITNLIIYTVDGLNNSNLIKSCNLKKGIKKIRVFFIIDDNGNIHVKKILGNWTENFRNEISKIMESTPNIIPAKQSGINVPVKFSVKIPYIIK